MRGFSGTMNKALQNKHHKVKVTPDLRGCPLGKKSYARHFKGKHGPLHNVGKVNKWRFRKKKNQLPVFFNSAKENCKNDFENDHASFNQINELIGYQSSADFCEIWLEHSLDVVKPKCVGDF